MKAFNFPWFQDSFFRFERYIKNTGWLIFDKVLRLAVGFFITAYLARYLGPLEFGQLNYAIALVSLFGVLGHLGLESIVVRELVGSDYSPESVLGTSFFLRLAGSFFAVALCLLTAFYFLEVSENVRNMILIISLGFLPQTFELLNSFFRSQSTSRITVVNGLVVLFCGLMIRYFLIQNQAPVTYFAGVLLFEQILSYSLLIFFHASKVNLKKWKFEQKTALTFLAESWPWMISSVSVLIYMKIDQIMINAFLGDTANGLYSAALKISEAWYFVPMAMTTSFYPLVVKASKESPEAYENAMEKIFLAVVLLSLAMAVLIQFLGKPLVLLIFGNAYEGASSVLILHIWTGVFVGLGVARSLWISNEKISQFTLFFSILPAFLNAGLNYFFIPSYGIVGAALATLICQIFASYLLGACFKRTRPIFILQTKALFLLPAFKLIWNKANRKGAS